MNQPTDATSAADTTFEALAASRREWIESVLRPWCRIACRAELIKADAEWHDIAGRVDSAATLWSWAWERFPDLVHPDLAGPNETHRVEVTLENGDTFTGFPNNRESVRGNLVLLDTADGTEYTYGPFPIDSITAVGKIDEQAA